jgi:hypothetical protein
MSPLEHPGTPNRHRSKHLCGNFSDRWIQYRKTLKNEGDFLQNVTAEDLLLGCRGDEKLMNFIINYEEPQSI